MRSRNHLFPSTPAACAAVMALALWVASSASAHAPAAHDFSSEIWTAWQWELEILLGLGLAAGIFLSGVLRGASLSVWRQVSFYSGLVAFLVALQSPLDAIAGRLFAGHQVQHLLLRMIGPMLLALALPGPALLRGLPSLVRSRVVRPLLRTRVLHWTRLTTTHPVLVTILDLGTLFFWQVPRFHDASVLDDAVHYAMHATMLLSGLLFWWCILSPHRFPFGWRFGARIVILWISVVANIVLGIYVFLEDRVLYRSYDALGRVFAIDAGLDQQVGGLILWIPPSMMTVVALLIVISRWMHANRAPAAAATGARHAAGAPAGTGRSRSRIGNQVLVLALVLFAAVLFAATILVSGLSLSTTP